MFCYQYVRRDEVFVRQVHAPDPLTELPVSLLDLQLFPRVRLIASTLTIETQSGRLVEARQRAIDEHTVKKEKIVNNRAKVLEERQKEEENRRRVLKAFKEDRLKPHGLANEDVELNEAPGGRKKKKEVKIHTLWNSNDTHTADNKEDDYLSDQN